MQTRLDIVSSEGLSQCLSGKADFAAAVVSIPELPTLHILLAGETPVSRRNCYGPIECGT